MQKQQSKVKSENKIYKFYLMIMKQAADFDFVFAFIILVLLSIGLILLSSASLYHSLKDYGDPNYHFYRQLGFAAIGFIILFIISKANYQILKTKLALIIGGIIVLIPNILVILMGVTKGGAKRWLNIGPIDIQPSELLKVYIIILLAYFGEKSYEKAALYENNNKSSRFFKSFFFPFILPAFFACSITVGQSHLSGTIIILAVAFSMIVCAGCRWVHIGITSLVASIGVGLGILYFYLSGKMYVFSRITSFLNPEEDTLGKFYQTNQSLIAIGSGGWGGVGLTNSRQKYGYLPFPHNDFIFSIACEEFGFIGALVIILLFIIFIGRGFYIARNAGDKFGSLIAMGITFHLGFQVMLNIGVASNSIPNTGISLPFFSYGGTALLIQLAECGLLLGVSRKAALR